MRARKKIFTRKFCIPFEDREIITSKDNTKKIAKAHEDVIITEPDGSQYSMSKAIFEKRYKVINEHEAETIPVEIDFVLNTTSLPIRFKANWGEDITAYSNAAIVIERGTFSYAIQKDEFESTYEVI